MLEGGEPIGVKGFDREFYLGGFYQIDGLTEAQLAQIEAGDFSPMTQQLEALPEGEERDNIMFALVDKVTDLSKKVDAAWEVAIEQSDMVAIKKLHDIYSTLDSLTQRLYSFCSGR